MSGRMDTGARVTIEDDPQRPGAVVLVIERARRTRRVWLAADEAEQVRNKLNAKLPPVTVTRRAS